MQRYDTHNIRNTISGLKEIKTSAFVNKNGLVDFRQVREICRIIDTLTLPLYYIWEYDCHRQLAELDFEKHLEKPYHKFLHNPVTNTWRLYLLVSAESVFSNRLGKLSDDVRNIYKLFLEHYEAMQGLKDRKYHFETNN